VKKTFRSLCLLLAGGARGWFSTRPDPVDSDSLGEFPRTPGTYVFNTSGVPTLTGPGVRIEGPVVDHVHKEKTTMTQAFARAIVVTSSLLAQAPLLGQHAPEPVNDVITLPGGVFCALDVQATVSGKAKTIQLPNGGFIATSPGLDMTLTNLSDTSRQVSLNITGAVHGSTDASGLTTGFATGRSVLFNPSGPFKGIVLIIGSFTFGATADPTQPVQVFEGEGQLIDACALIS